MAIPPTKKRRTPRKVVPTSRLRRPSPVDIPLLRFRPTHRGRHRRPRRQPLAAIPPVRFRRSSRPPVAIPSLRLLHSSRSPGAYSADIHLMGTLACRRKNPLLRFDVQVRMSKSVEIVPLPSDLLVRRYHSLRFPFGRIRRPLGIIQIVTMARRFLWTGNMKTTGQSAWTTGNGNEPPLAAPQIRQICIYPLTSGATSCSTATDTAGRKPKRPPGWSRPRGGGGR